MLYQYNDLNLDLKVIERNGSHSISFGREQTVVEVSLAGVVLGFTVQQQLCSSFPLRTCNGLILWTVLCVLLRFPAL